MRVPGSDRRPPSSDAALFLIALLLLPLPMPLPSAARALAPSARPPPPTTPGAAPTMSSQSRRAAPGPPPSQTPAAGRHSPRVVQTQSGALRGIVLELRSLGVRAGLSSGRSQQGQQGVQVPPLESVEAFWGVRYAEPPTGELRFAPPKAAGKWEGVRLADRFAPVCPQKFPVDFFNRTEALSIMPKGRYLRLRRTLPLLTNQSEDCLFLNLYVPGGGVPRNGSSFAVIFYVHGESFEWNSGNPYDGSVLSSLGRVIVVTINFRLGVLGFLQTGPTRYETHDDPTTVQGNWGLLDVLEALRWVRKNVEAFGGDKDRVTIVGHHTGAALVHLLLVSTAAKGLFQRAAMLSGSAQSLWAVVREPRALRRQVAERLGCLAPTQPHPAFRAPTHTAGPPPAAPQGEDVDVAPCLRRASLRALLDSYPPALRFLARFAPATRHDDTGPWLEAPAALHPGPASRTPLLLSVATAEAYAELSAQDVRWGLEEERRDALLRTFVANAYHYHRREILAAVKNEYTEWLGLGADPRARSQRSAKFGDGPPVPPSAPTAAAVAPVARHHLHPITVRDATVEALGDGQTVAPLVAVCREHAGRRGAATYFLHFSHHAKDGVDYAQERLGSAPEEVVAHLFGVPVLGGTTPVLEAYSTEPTELPLNYTKQDVGVAVTMIRYVANFAKSGDPNWESQSERDAAVARGQPWPSGKSDQQHFPPMWMPFDLTSQLYLNMGPKPKMRSHYRSHKMALWLNLIPQLHHSQDEEDMSPHHEFLEKEDQYYAGATLNKSIMDPYWRLGAVWVKSALQSAADPAPMDCDPPEGDPEDDGLNPSSFADPSLPPLNTSATPDADSGPGHSGEIEPGDYFAALSITVTLGVVLLLLNAAVLVAGVVHHNRQKARDSGRRGKGTVKKKPRKAKGKAADEAGSGSERSSGDHHYGVFGDYLDSVPDSKKDYVTDVGTELGLVLPHRAYPDVMDHELCFRKDSSRSLDRCCGGDQQAVRLKKKSQIRSTFGGAAVGSMGALHAPDTSSLSRKKPPSGTATFPRSKPPTGQEAPSPRTPIVKRRVQEISV